jgi:putative flippase GtrA
MPCKGLESNSFLRFLFSGAINALVTYPLFVFLASVLPYGFAYTVTYVAGMILSYWLAAKFVFGTGFAIRSALHFPVIYVLQYLYGLGTLFILIDALGFSRHVAMLVVIITSFPLTFMLQRHAMRPDSTLRLWVAK